MGFFVFNVECKGQAAQVDSLIVTLLRHEGFGTKGIKANANGHEARGRWAAGLKDNDPHHIAEPLTGAEAWMLHAAVRNEVARADEEISVIAADVTHQYVRDNGWCDKLWVYHTSEASGPNRRFREIELFPGICP